MKVPEAIVFKLQAVSFASLKRSAVTMHWIVDSPSYVLTKALHLRKFFLRCFRSWQS